MQLFGDLRILSFVIVSQLNWIGHVNRMEGKTTVIQVFNITPEGC
jgi:vacuolar-type H+-ATPase catalytic subunit A/Vma1